MSAPLTADQALEACRTLGLRYTPDLRQRDGLWSAVCPVCVLHADGQPLTIREPSRDRPVTFSCKSGCPSQEIANVLAEAVLPKESSSSGEHERRPSEAHPHIFESAAALLKEPDPGPTPFLVDQLLTAKTVACILGTYKVGKTWTLDEIAVCVVSGEPAFGRYAVPDSGPVVIVLQVAASRRSRAGQGGPSGRRGRHPRHAGRGGQRRRCRSRWRHGAAPARLSAQEHSPRRRAGVAEQLAHAVTTRWV